MPEQPADHAASLGLAAGATGTPDESDVVDVVVLAGGTGRRLGGAVKPDVVARGARLLDHVLAGLERLRDRGLPFGHVCVVAPAEVDLPTGVLRALEDPPLGGPV
ncbi:molybdopterin-guanine dinucleotide biosynthesis protein MobA, partial [Actinomyces naeslundii]